ncbi:MAG: hypothetical protein RL494_400, partial [Bacteroidota bacterium]
KATLDIIATNSAAPTPTDGILVPRINAFPATNPTIDQNGILVFLTIGTVTYPIGFYYWDHGSTSWKPVSGADKDWLQEGTGLPPQTITDNKYTLGNVVIGKNTVSFDTKFEVENSDTNVSLRLNNTYDVPLSQSNKYGIYNTMNAEEYQTGLQNNLFGNGNAKTGIENSFSGIMSNIGVGFGNTFTTTGAGNQFGMYNTFASSSSSGSTWGIRNWFQSTAGYTGIIIGIANDMSANNTANTNPQYAITNTFTGYGSGAKYGISNTFAATSNGEQFGLHNTFNSNNNNMNYGVYNNFPSGTSTSSKYGIRNDFNMTTIAPFYGAYTSVTGTGGGIHYGGYAGISSTGSAAKYGFASVIYSTAGGQHFGIYGSATKAGATNYAGYFLGNVHVTGTFTNPSDKTLKENIQNTPSVLAKIKKIEVKDYNFKKDLSEKYGFPRNQQSGFMAQDFETIFPNLVKDDVLHIPAKPEEKQSEPDRNIKTINYIGMIPLLTKAIQEQQSLIEAQQEEMNQIKKQLESYKEFEARIKKLEKN